MTRAKSPDELEWTRGRFLDAALTVFAEKGFYGATMEEISIAAGYSGSAVYKYLKTKTRFSSRPKTASLRKC